MPASTKSKKPELSTHFAYDPSPVSETELRQHADAAGARRVTEADVEGAIVTERYFTAAEGVLGGRLVDNRFSLTPQRGENILEGQGSLNQLTFCVLTLRNGFTLVGQSACADPAGFDAEIGRRIARSDAVNKIWAFLGFELCTELTKEQG